MYSYFTTSKDELQVVKIFAQTVFSEITQAVHLPQLKYLRYPVANGGLYTMVYECKQFLCVFLCLSDLRTKVKVATLTVAISTLSGFKGLYISQAIDLASIWGPYIDEDTMRKISSNVRVGLHMCLFVVSPTIFGYRL